MPRTTLAHLTPKCVSGLVQAGVGRIVTILAPFICASFLAGSYPMLIKVLTSGPGPWAIGLSKSWLGRAIWGLTVRRRALPCPCLAPAYEHLGHEVVPARLVASLMIPVCSATFSYASGSSDSQLEPCLDRLGIGRLDWRLPSMPYVQTLTMRYASI